MLQTKFLKNSEYGDVRIRYPRCGRYSDSWNHKGRVFELPLPDLDCPGDLSSFIALFFTVCAPNKQPKNPLKGPKLPGKHRFHRYSSGNSTKNGKLIIS